MSGWRELQPPNRRGRPSPPVLKGVPSVQWDVDGQRSLFFDLRWSVLFRVPTYGAYENHVMVAVARAEARGAPCAFCPLLPAGITAAEDQQLAGLVMWIPGGLVHFIAAIVVASGALRRRGATGSARISQCLILLPAAGYRLLPCSPPSQPE
jgi:hypothetical protein